MEDDLELERWRPMAGETEWVDEALLCLGGKGKGLEATTGEEAVEGESEGEGKGCGWVTARSMLIEAILGTGGASLGVEWLELPRRSCSERKWRSGPREGRFLGSAVAFEALSGDPPPKRKAAPRGEGFLSEPVEAEVDIDCGVTVTEDEADELVETE